MRKNLKTGIGIFTIASIALFINTLKLHNPTLNIIIWITILVSVTWLMILISKK